MSPLKLRLELYRPWCTIGSLQTLEIRVPSTRRRGFCVRAYTYSRGWILLPRERRNVSSGAFEFYSKHVACAGSRPNVVSPPSEGKTGLSYLTNRQGKSRMDEEKRREEEKCWRVPSDPEGYLGQQVQRQPRVEWKSYPFSFFCRNEILSRG